MPKLAEREQTTVAAILRELEPLGQDGYRRIMLNHGAEEPCFGVKIEELKKIQKRIRKDHELALGLYDTGVYDAMYLAGLIADESRMTKEDLQRWVDRASKPLIGSTVPWVAAESRFGREIGLEWIDSSRELIAAAGWHTLTSLLSLQNREELEEEEVRGLLARVRREIHSSPDRVRYAMNSFVIGVGSYLPALTAEAIETGEQIGPVMVDMGNTACQVPYSPDHIRKAEARGTIGKRRKSARC